jgi:hypothetical protein
MGRLYFYVEGQTVHEHVANVLRPHLAGFGVQARLGCGTSPA